MGVMINLYFDEQIVTPHEANRLLGTIQAIVKDVMNKQDVFALSVSPLQFLSSDPIELFVQVNALKITDVAELADGLSEEIKAWRSTNNFPHPINLNVIPVEWHSRLGL